MFFSEKYGLYSAQQLIFLPFPSWKKELANCGKISGAGTFPLNGFTLPIKAVEL